MAGQSGLHYVTLHFLLIIA